MKRLLFPAALAALALAGSTLGYCQSTKDKTAVDNKLTKAAQIIDEMTGPNATAGVPRKVLEDAQCIAVIPDLLQAGFVVGAHHGKGVATCRSAGNHWSPPAPFSLTGGSFGAQIGGEDISLIMMVMNHDGMQALESGHFKVGAGVSAAAGPVGRDANAAAGYKAAILTYSRSKGAYVGATVQGAELQQDKGETKALYGQEIPFANILNGQVKAPENADVRDFLRTIQHAEASAHAQ